MLSRCQLLCAGSSDFRSTAKIADEFQHVLLRSRWACDHVAVDVGYLCAIAGRLTRNLVGSERDAEACKAVLRHLSNNVLRRVGGDKSLALMLDGSEPLWKVQHMRLHPGKKFSEKFYRSAGSPMVYLLEEKLLAMGPELRPAPQEFLVSGAGVPGSAEGKMSAWVLDLATRIPHRATNPPQAPAVTPNDSVCLVGGTDLFLNVLAATPFHNVTAVTFNAGEVRSLTLADCLAWLGLGDLLAPVITPTPTSTATAPTAGTGEGNERHLQQQRLAAVRTDVVLLYLLINGTSSTGLPPLGSLTFAEVMEGYLVELKRFTPTVVVGKASEQDSNSRGHDSGGGSRYLAGMLFDEYPLAIPHRNRGAGEASTTTVAATLLPSLRLKPEALARVLTRAARRTISFPSRYCASSANYLEVLLQSHAMVSSGGVQNMGWVPPEYGENVPEKPPKIPLDQFVGHLRAVAAATSGAVAAQAMGSSAGGSLFTPPYIYPTRSRSMALTGVESLLLTSPEPAIIDQVVPMYARGHSMPSGVSADIVQTRNVHHALTKTRAALAGLTSSESKGQTAAPPQHHPAIAHRPTHYLVRAPSPAGRGPPPGWIYASVNLGLKAEAMNIRYSLNASDTVLLREMSSAADRGLSTRNCMFVFDARAQAWLETPCDAIGEPEKSGGGTARGQADGGASGNTSSYTHPNDISLDDESMEGNRISTLRVLTWNTQFDRHSGERTPLGRDGIDWCTRTRYLALSKALAESDADVIAMQEVEAPWCAFLAAQPWVRSHYAMSCQSHSHAIAPWGVLMLVRRTLPATGFGHANVPAFSGHTSAMPNVTLALGPQSPMVTIWSMHLLAPYNPSNVHNRETQLANLVRYLESSSANGSTGHATSGGARGRIIMGDFNDYPAKLFQFPAELGFKDAWEALHPRCNELAISNPSTPNANSTAAETGGKNSTVEDEISEERGFTIDGVANPYAGRIIEPQFYGRPDRVMYSSGTALQPVHVERIGTTSVAEMLASDGVTHLVERPTEAIPTYLFPSDHFGVLVEFQIV